MLDARAEERRLPISPATPFPRLGLGTWQLRGDACREAVEDALAIGYRHLDTAQGYENEREVGAALAASGVPRESVWLTTKLWVDGLPADDVRRAVGESLERLSTPYVDAVLVHWPPRTTPLEPAIEALAECRERGAARAVGVSNFPPALLDRALAVTPIFANQIEVHPYLGARQAVAHARERGVLVVAYGPLAQGRVAADPVLGAIGARHGKTATQVALRWLLDRGLATIPKAASAAHRRANLDVLDLLLAAEETASIDALDRGLRLVDPEWAPDWDH